MSFTDRLVDGISAFIERRWGPRIDACAKYAGRVVLQRDDGTIDVQPDSPKLPGLVGLSCHFTVPGVELKVAKGARCDVMFVDGDRSKPTIVGFEGDGLVELKITATTKITINAPSITLADGHRPLACVGDIVQVSGIAPGAIILLDSTGHPCTGTMTLVGQITQGQDIAKAP